MNKYILIGPPGAGKSTQASMLADAHDLVRISVGDIFRWNIKNHTKLAAKIHRYIDSGQLVPDEIVEQVAKIRLDQHDWNFGFIMDGYPATQAQAEFFLESYDVDGVILLEVPDKVVSERLSSLRVCQECGLDYNLILYRPKSDEACEVCGGALTHRSSETPEVISGRIRDYHHKTEPVLDLFRRKELVVSIDGTKAPEGIYADICAELALGPV
jgi:adenylate kinase